MEYDYNVVTKKRKLYQDVLPAEMIENIVSLCPNLITLGSLACTCKQIKNLVHKIFSKNNISLKFHWLIGERLTEQTDVKYSLKGNGDAKRNISYENETSDRIETTWTHKSQKKIANRFKFARLCTKLLNIMNMNDTTKFEEIIDKYREDPLFNTNIEKLSFDITINEQVFNYKYVHCSRVWEFSRENSSNIHTEKNFEEISWYTLDKYMIQRLKCALCAIKVRNFFEKIPDENTSTKI